MKPTTDTEMHLLLARIFAGSAQVYAKQHQWERAARYATEAGNQMKKVIWEVEQ